jgi:hypothetical protein
MFGTIAEARALSRISGGSGQSGDGNLFAVTLPRLLLVSGPPGGRVRPPSPTPSDAFSSSPWYLVTRLRKAWSTGGPREFPPWGAPIAEEAFALFYRVVAECVRSGSVQ